MTGPAVCLHAYVSASPLGSVDPVPSSATGTFFGTIRSGPASAVGGALITFTFTASFEVPPQPSATVRVNRYVPAVLGLNVSVAVSAPERDTGGPAAWTHPYMRESPSRSTLPVPSSVMETCLATSRSGPASAIGGRFWMSTEIVSTSLWFVVSHTVRVVRYVPRAP